jgi:DNA-binding NarL/FixJ family response regulator
MRRAPAWIRARSWSPRVALTWRPTRALASEAIGDGPEYRYGGAVLSAYQTDESAAAVRAAGAYAFLPKDCTAELIRDTVLAAWRRDGA